MTNGEAKKMQAEKIELTAKAILKITGRKSVTIGETLKLDGRIYRVEAQTFHPTRSSDLGKHEGHAETYSLWPQRWTH